MVPAEAVRQMGQLAELGWGAKRIARELGVARNTVRRYLRGARAEVQEHLAARRLDETARAEALRLFGAEAEGNAVVVTRLLRDQGVEASVRTVQRVVEERRRRERASQVATVRFETAPGEQMQVDVGQRLVRIAGQMVRVFFVCAVLGFSRRLFVRAFLSARQDDWREGIAAAFQRFGGVPRTLLIDNDGALVIGRDEATQTARLHPAFAAFCRDFGVEARVCRPYRARTKGKTESGVKYVKRNAIAGRDFGSFADFEGHLDGWMREADERVHGTTHERPIDRFLREELSALRPLPAHPLSVRERRLRRKVANDALVDIDTVRYSVPHRLVRSDVEVLVGETEVRIYSGAELVATHARSREPHTSVIDFAHYRGLWRQPSQPPDAEAPGALEALGRSLADYQAALGGGAR
ncbi:MAG: IS21 family transposase [Myxococcales bacterium]